MASDYLLWGDLRTENGTYKETARDDLEKALTIRKEWFGEHHTLVGECYFSLGHRCRVQGRYEEALEYLQAALRIWRKYQEDGDANKLGDTLHEMGLVLVEQKELDRGLENFEESLSSREGSSKSSDGSSPEEKSEKICMAV